MFNINDNISTKSLVLKKIEMDKDERKVLLRNIIQEIFSIVKQSDRQYFNAKTVLNVYRFSVKFDGIRRIFEWRDIFPGNSDGTSELAIYEQGELKTYKIPTCKMTERIEELVIGTPESRKDKKPTFLFPLLNGNRFERFKVRKMASLDGNYWDSWDKQKALYRELIYPNVLAALQRIIPLFSQQVRILELCGGDGEFAANLFKEANLSKNITYYLLVDLNEKSIEKAKEQLNNESRFETFKCDVTKLDEALDTESCTNKFDVVFGIGALTEHVMSNKTQARVALEQATSLLKPNGVMLFTGLASSLLGSWDFEACGLKVTNCFSTNTYESYGDQADAEFYIAQKPDPEFKTETKLWPNFPTYSPRITDLNAASAALGTIH